MTILFNVPNIACCYKKPGDVFFEGYVFDFPIQEYLIDDYLSLKKVNINECIF